jgi:hypothetical protein
MWVAAHCSDAEGKPKVDCGPVLEARRGKPDDQISPSEGVSIFDGDETDDTGELQG